MSALSIQKAAILTGQSRAAIEAAMNAGTLSFSVDENGTRTIDQSELNRVYGNSTKDNNRKESGKNKPRNPKNRAVDRTVSDQLQQELEKTAQMLETERMKMRIKMLEDQLFMTREQLDDIKSQRDEWQKQAQQMLITSQTSQKQAEELKEELRERDRREAERKAALEERLKKLKARTQNQNVATSAPQQLTAGPAEPRTFWEKLKMRVQKTA